MDGLRVGDKVHYVPDAGPGECWAATVVRVVGRHMGVVDLRIDIPRPGVTEYQPQVAFGLSHRERGRWHFKVHIPSGVIEALGDRDGGDDDLDAAG